MRKTITLPLLPSGSYVGYVSAIKEIKNSTIFYEQDSSNSLQGRDVDLPADVLLALIDAAKNPVCPACGRNLSFPICRKNDDPYIHPCYQQHCCCGARSFYIDTNKIKLPEWFGINLACDAALRSSAVIRKYLESLKKESSDV